MERKRIKVHFKHQLPEEYQVWIWSGDKVAVNEWIACVMQKNPAFDDNKNCPTVRIQYAGSTKVFLFFRGPKAGVSINFDDVSFSKYVPPESDCKDLITNREAKVR